MEADLKLMEELKDQIERGRINFKKSPKERITPSYVLTRLEGIEKITEKFCNKHESMICTYDYEDLKESSYIKKDVFNAGYETYLMYKSELKAALTVMEYSARSTKQSSSFSENKESIVRLPRISLPIFTGHYSEWLSFKDLFVSLVHNNSNLDDVQRLHYLKTQLKGEAEQLIKHINITQANYKTCWDLLKTRYDNKRFMSDCILKRCFDQRVLNYESSSGLKNLIDTTCDCLHELSNLGINVESWDLIVIYIISMKLDTETRKQWELQVNSSSSEIPTLQQFKQFLECRSRAFEVLELSKSKTKLDHINNETKSIQVTSEVRCPYCNKNHKLFSCSQFAKEDVKTRLRIVNSLSLCYNCLGNNHIGKMCRRPITCRMCKRKHHTLLHNRSNSYNTAVAMDEIKTNQVDMSLPVLYNSSTKNVNKKSSVRNYGYCNDNSRNKSLESNLSYKGLRGKIKKYMSLRNMKDFNKNYTVQNIRQTERSPRCTNLGSDKTRIVPWKVLSRSGNNAYYGSPLRDKLVVNSTLQPKTHHLIMQ